jgi:hypothetical protein
MGLNELFTLIAAVFMTVIFSVIISSKSCACRYSGSITNSTVQVFDRC